MPFPSQGLMWSANKAQFPEYAGNDPSATGTRCFYAGVAWEFVKVTTDSGKEVYTWKPLDPAILYNEAKAAWDDLMKLG